MACIMLDLSLEILTLLSYTPVCMAAVQRLAMQLVCAVMLTGVVLRMASWQECRTNITFGFR